MLMLLAASTLLYDYVVGSFFVNFFLGHTLVVGVKLKA